MSTGAAKEELTPELLAKVKIGSGDSKKIAEPFEHIIAMIRDKTNNGTFERLYRQRLAYWRMKHPIQAIEKYLGSDTKKKNKD